MRILDPDAAALVRALAAAAKRRLKAAMRTLADARSRGASKDIKRAVSPDDVGAVYRLRVGDHRIASILDGRDVLVLRVLRRREGYAWLRAGDGEP